MPEWPILARSVAVPLVGAFIGWITNKLAVKLIFRPHEPLGFSFLPLKIQGVIPKRRYEISKNIGKIVEEELLSINDLTSYMSKPEIKSKIIIMLNGSLKHTIMDRLPDILPTGVKGTLANALVAMLSKQLPEQIDSVLSDVSGRLADEVRISQLVEEKINAFDLQEMENMVLEVASRELGHIELMGAVLGFIIGLVQLGIVIIFS